MMKRTLSARRVVPAAAFAVLALQACSCSDGNGTGPDGYDARDVPAGDDIFADDVTADVAGEPCDGDGDCEGNAYCSTAGFCTPDGRCLVDEDCAPGLHCGQGSHTCLEEGACLAVDDCDPGLACNDDGICQDCGSSEFGTTRLGPNVLVVLDRSGSMEGDIDGRTRWDIAKEAAMTVCQNFDSDIRFGLATFSACLPGGCSPGTIVVDIADGNAAAIVGFLTPLLGQGSPTGAPPAYLCDSGDPETTTGPTLQALVGEPQLQDPARLNAVLLLSDGHESTECDGPDGDEAAAALFGQDVPVRTYAVGFTTDADMALMDAIAAAGGTTGAYYADDLDGLLAAFESIAMDVMTCDFLLGDVPPEPDKLYVYFNDDPAGISSDPVDGWTYDSATNTIHFHGAACDLILEGGVSDIDVVYGCPGPTIL
jgi:hypothetical protein